MKITEIEVETMNATQTHIVIDWENGNFTSMPKSVWDEQQAAKEAQSLTSPNTDPTA